MNKPLQAVDEIVHIIEHHIIQAKGMNLDQYRTEHTCACGIPIITDGHNPNEPGLMHRQAEHIADELTAWHNKQLETKVREALEDLLKQGYTVNLNGITEIPVVNQSTIEMALAALRHQNTAGVEKEQ